MWKMQLFAGRRAWRQVSLIRIVQPCPSLQPKIGRYCCNRPTTLSGMPTRRTTFARNLRSVENHADVTSVRFSRFQACGRKKPSHRWVAITLKNTHNSEAESEVTLAAGDEMRAQQVYVCTSQPM